MRDNMRTIIKIFKRLTRCKKIRSALSLATFINQDFASYHLKGVRFPMLGYQDQDWMVNVPLYAARQYILAQE